MMSYMTEVTLEVGPFVSPLTRPLGQLYRMVLLADLMQCWKVSLQLIKPTTYLFRLLSNIC